MLVECVPFFDVLYYLKVLLAAVLAAVVALSECLPGPAAPVAPAGPRPLVKNDKSDLSTDSSYGLGYAYGGAYGYGSPYYANSYYGYGYPYGYSYSYPYYGHSYGYGYPYY